MIAGTIPDGLTLTEEEAYALLSLCLTSPNGLDNVSERALKKLADYCIKSHHSEGHIIPPASYLGTRELGKAGA